MKNQDEIVREVAGLMGVAMLGVGLWYVDWRLSIGVIGGLLLAGAIYGTLSPPREKQDTNGSRRRHNATPNDNAKRRIER